MNKMTERNNEENSNAPASPDVSSPRLPYPTRKHKKNWLPSLVWLIPLIAALVGLALIINVLNKRGPEISISFKTAEGLAAGKTKIKYKDVDIGEVENITLSKDRSKVVVNVQLNKDASFFTAKDTRFWVVKPRLDPSGISGLSTLFSGAYIAADAGESKEYVRTFVGLETQPIVTKDDNGKQFILRAKDIGSLDIGSPVFYRRLKVGRVAAYNLDEDGKGVNLRIFIEQPYTKFVGLNTRFWHTNGIDVQFDASGFKLNTQSLATLALGGLSFLSAGDEPGPIAKENTAYLLADDQTSAFKEPDGQSNTAILYFNHSIRGLKPGAPVDFRGVEIGEVQTIGIEYIKKTHQFRMPVAIVVYPERLGNTFNEANDSESKTHKKERIQAMIQDGLRAQLRTGSILTGQKYIAIDFFPNVAKSTLASNEINEIPTIPGSFDELQGNLEEIAKKLSSVPFDQIGQEMQTTLTTMHQTLADAGQLAKSLNNDIVPEMKSAMSDVRNTLDNADQTLASANKAFHNAEGTLSEDSVIQQDLRKTLQELSRAAASMKVLTDYLEQHPESILRGKQADKLE
jgi:paraquat-inducible protein B